MSNDQPQSKPAKARKSPAKIVRKKKNARKKCDPAKPFINARWEAFVQGVAAGKSQTQAYVDAGYLGEYDICRRKASLLMTNSDIRDRITHLSGKLTEKRQEVAATRDIMSKAELLERTTKIIRADLSDFISVDQDGELFVQITKENYQIVMNRAVKRVKLRRIVDESGNTVMGLHLTEVELEPFGATAKLLADLMGYNAPVKVDSTVRTVPDLCGLSDDQLPELAKMLRAVTVDEDD